MRTITLLSLILLHAFSLSGMETSDHDDIELNDHDTIESAKTESIEKVSKKWELPTLGTVCKAAAFMVLIGANFTGSLMATEGTDGLKEAYSPLRMIPDIHVGNCYYTRSEFERNPNCTYYRHLGSGYPSYAKGECTCPKEGCYCSCMIEQCAEPEPFKTSYMKTMIGNTVSLASNFALSILGIIAIFHRK